jgi:hypothetical protein
LIGEQPPVAWERRDRCSPTGGPRGGILGQVAGSVRRIELHQRCLICEEPETRGVAEDRLQVEHLRVDALVRSTAAVSVPLAGIVRTA